MVLIATALGAWHGASQHQQNVAAAEARALEERERASRPADGSAAAPNPASLDTAPLLDQVQRAEAALAAGHFQDALVLAKRMLEAIPGGTRTDAVVEPDVHRALAVQGRARLLAALERQIEPAIFSGRDDLVEVELESGKLYILRILEETASRVRLQNASGVELSFAPGSIRSRRSLSAADWRARNEAEIARRLSGAGPQSAFEFYRVALFCLRNGAVDRGRALLKDAVHRDTTGGLAEMFASPTDRPRKAERIAMYDSADGDPARAVSAWARSLPAPSPGAPMATAHTGSGSTEPSGVAAASSGPSGRPTWTRHDSFGRARVAQDAGLGHYRASFALEGARARSESQQAMARFREALSLLEIVARDHPEAASAISEQQRRLQQYLLDLVKTANLGR
jgi:hypothetical protein